MSPLTTHTHTSHHSVLALGWNYRSDFSLVEMKEDDSGRLNQGAMNQCLIKPQALGMNCQHRNSSHHAHTGTHTVNKYLLSTVGHSYVTAGVWRLSGAVVRTFVPLPVHRLFLCSVILLVREGRVRRGLACLIQQLHDKPRHHVDL